MIELVITEDGSPTCFDPESGEHYHNRAGAYTEALQNYLLPSAAIAKLQKQGSLVLLDSCFGLGYNTFVVIEQALAAAAQGRIEIVALELHKEILATTRDVLAIEQFERTRQLFDVNEPLSFGTYRRQVGALEVQLSLLQGDLRRLVPQLNGEFDLIYHDPFSWRQAPELWTLELFKEYFRLLQTRSGEVLTYSAAGPVRGALAEAGFSLYRSGSVGRRAAGTVACVCPFSQLRDGVYELSEVDQSKLSGIGGVPFRDSDFGWSRAQINDARALDQSRRKQS